MRINDPAELLELPRSDAILFNLWVNFPHPENSLNPSPDLEIFDWAGLRELLMEPRFTTAGCYQKQRTSL